MNLFTPIKIKNITIQNRVVVPPMVRFSMIGTDGFVTDTLLKWYEDLAYNQVGLIIIEATCVNKNGKLRENQLGIWDNSFIPKLKELASIGHKYNVPMLLQIHHIGFLNRLNSISTETLDSILDDFTKAFFRAKECGFHGIEIHGAHGYLISQLNSNLENNRNDKFGGSIDNRMYFIKELLRRTKVLFDDNFILSYRMGGNEPTLEEGIKNAKYLENLGIDILHVSSGIPDPSFKSQEKIVIPQNFNFDWVIYMGCEIKKHVNTPVIGVRWITEEEQASYLIENKMLDLVAIGRAMIGKPFWIKIAKENYIKRKEADQKLQK